MCVDAITKIQVNHDQSVHRSINQSTYPIQSMDRSINKLQLNLPQ